MKWPLTDKKEILRSEYFQEDQRLAQKAGLNLTDFTLLFNIIDVCSDFESAWRLDFVNLIFNRFNLPAFIIAILRGYTHSFISFDTEWV